MIFAVMLVTMSVSPSPLMSTNMIAFPLFLGAESL